MARQASTRSGRVLARLRRSQQKYVSGNGGTQPGQAARAIIRAVEADDPPQRLPLGDNAVDAILGKLDSLRD
jgi:hypothetical protein